MQEKVLYTLYHQLLKPKNLVKAFKQVAKAKGAAGVDGQTIKQFKAQIRVELPKLHEELKTKVYKPKPVLRVRIPKDGGGERLLGIPCVRDRIVQQALSNILTPIFDPHFHPSSYGYRPKRSAHDAINKASDFIRQYDLEHVVDMDLSKCFDKLDHEIIMQQIKKRVVDGSILNLINLFLKSGVEDNGRLDETLLGSPQGGVISPLIANIYLDAFDQEMMKRGHRIVRYADDILIFKQSRRSAENALQVATKILETDLKLIINREKTHITDSAKGVKFLGVTIYKGFTRIQDKKLNTFKEKVKSLTKRSTSLGMASIIEKLNLVIRGFGQYFKIANSKRSYVTLMAWIRRRLRAVQLKSWKRPSRLHRRLRQLGYNGKFKHIKMNNWRNSGSPLAHYAMPNKWFEELKLFDLTTLHK